MSSIINVAIVLTISTPLLWLDLSSWEKKLIIIGLFFVYSSIFLIFNHNRDAGMIIGKTRWKEEYPLWRHFIYNVLYTASFSTLLFWVILPFDLFLVNMICLQLPSVLLAGTTFHGYVAGGMVTVVDKSSINN